MSMHDVSVFGSTVGFPTTIAPLIQNRLKAVFTDIDMKDLNFDLDEVEKKITKNTKAIFCLLYTSDAADE